MIIQKIELQGFGSYKNKTVVEVNQGITAIVASYDGNSKRSNAGGKSTLIMAVLYALYGEGEYNTLSELINDKCDSMYVKLFFQLKGNNYVIERGIQKKTSYLDFFRVVEKPEEDIRLGKGIDDTQIEINNIMGMDNDMFSSSIFFEQGNMDKFTNVGSEKKREYIDKALELEIWRNLGKEALKVKKGFEKDFIALAEERDAVKDVIEKLIPSISQKPTVEREIVVYNKEKSNLNAVIIKYNKIYENMIRLEGIKNQIKSSTEFVNNMKEQLKTEQDKVFDIEKYDNKINELTKGIEFSKESLANVEKQFVQFNTEYDELNKSTMGFKLNISQLTMEIEHQKKHKNQSLSGVCPTCKQMVDMQLLEDENKVIDENIEKLHEQLKTQQTMLNEIEIKVIVQLKIIGDTGTFKNNISIGISKDENEIYKLELNKKQEIENQKKQQNTINFINAELGSLEKNLSNLILERDSIKIESMDVNIKDIQNQLQTVDKLINGLNLQLGSILSEEKRKIELEEKLEKIKKELDNIENNVYIYTVLSEFYMEIPKNLFFESVALIEEESNKLIQQVIPNLSVSIHEDDKKKSNPLVITFKENENDRSYKRLSGGTKSVANICIRLAFSFIIMNRAKTNLQFIVLDEPFGSLDEENRTLIKGIFSLLSTFFKQILVISHTDDINEFPNVIHVKKSIEGVSYI